MSSECSRVHIHCIVGGRRNMHAWSVGGGGQTRMRQRCPRRCHRSAMAAMASTAMAGPSAATLPGMNCRMHCSLSQTYTAPAGVHKARSSGVSPRSPVPVSPQARSLRQSMSVTKSPRTPPARAANSSRSRHTLMILVRRLQCTYTGQGVCSSPAATGVRGMQLRHRDEAERILRVDKVGFPPALPPCAAVLPHATGSACSIWAFTGCVGCCSDPCRD